MPEGIRGAVAFGATSKADEARPWDGAAAIGRLRTWAGGPDKDEIDWPKYRKGFGWYDEAASETYEAYKLPHHDVIDGGLVVVWRGVAAAMGRLLGSADIPEGDRRGVYDHLVAHYKQFEKEAPEFRNAECGVRNEGEPVIDRGAERAGGPPLPGGRPTPQDRFERTIEGEVRQVEGDETRIEVSFSSEEPVERWWGPEILSHDEEAVDLGRLAEIGVVLFNHDAGLPLGPVEKVWLDAEARKCRAQIRLDDDDVTAWYAAKIASGTLKGVSVGYRVDVWEEVGPGKTSSNGRFQGPCEVAVRWIPYEISIVSVPADATVGVGRSEDVTERGGSDGSMRAAAAAQGESARAREVDMEPDEAKGAAATVKAEEEQRAAEQIASAAVEAERTRVAEISTICRNCGMEPEEFIERGDSVESVRAAALQTMIERNRPVEGAPRVEVGAEPLDHLRAAAPHALLIRAGFQPDELRRAGIEKPHEMAEQLRGMSIRSIAEECVRLRGRQDASRLDVDVLMREALTPDSQFAGILDATIGHAMMIGHTAAGTTYQRWVKIGQNPNFKATPRYRLSEAAEPELVNQSGEMPFDEMSDEGVNTQVSTYGKRWGFTRQAMINDDLDMLTRVPRQYAIGAQRKINADVYAILNANPLVYDGNALFDTTIHANLAGSGAAPSVVTLGAGRQAMRSQVGLRGLQTLNIAPRFLVVGVGIETVSEQLIGSANDPAATTPSVVNPFRSLELVSDAAIADPLEWFLAADPGAIDTIEVTTLNGVITPTIESQVSFVVLGMMWRLYIDYGVTVLDYRGLFNNPGH